MVAINLISYFPKYPDSFTLLAAKRENVSSSTFSALLGTVILNIVLNSDEGVVAFHCVFNFHFPDDL